MILMTRPSTGEMLFASRAWASRGSGGNSLTGFSLGTLVFKLFGPFEYDSRDQGINIAEGISPRLDDRTQISAELGPRARPAIGDVVFLEFQKG
jgi:hypothetical protein